jgi:hypothetical protein
MKNKKTFRKGQVVKCKTNVVLVTGKGNKNEGDTTFAGLVISFLDNFTLLSI